MLKAFLSLRKLNLGVPPLIEMPFHPFLGPETGVEQERAGS